MSSYCCYKGCENVHRTFTDKPFFALPTDDRRSIWIENSGNDRLVGCPLNARRIFCEDHFDPKYIRRQFNRAILRKDAVPYPYSEEEMVEITEIDEPAESDETERRQPSAPHTSNKSNHLKFRVKTLPTPHRTHTIHTTAISLENGDGDGDSCDNDEIDVIIEATDSSDDTPSIDTHTKGRPESSASNGGPVPLKRKCYGGEKAPPPPPLPRQPAEPAATLKVERNEAALGLDTLVSSSDANEPNNEEMYFALSLVGILKRLPPHKRAKAKCHIMNYLTGLEFGS